MFPVVHVKSKTSNLLTDEAKEKLVPLQITPSFSIHFPFKFQALKNCPLKVQHASNRGGNADVFGTISCSHVITHTRCAGAGAFP